MSGPARRRIAITGAGVVSAWGWGVGPFWSGVVSGRPAIGAFDRFDPSGYFTRIAAQVPPENGAASEGLAASDRSPDPGSDGTHGASRADRFAEWAAREAIAGAELPGDLAERNAGVFFSSSTGGMLESEEFYARFRTGATAGASGFPCLRSQPVSSPGDRVARLLRVTGPVETESAACASATLAIGSALDDLRSGAIDVAIAGGSDSLCRTTYGGFNALRSVDGEPCRPFRADRAGLSLGEGAAVLVLEPLEDALARGARPIAELCGTGASADAHHMTAPDPDGGFPGVAVERAIRDARWTAEDIDFINAHGTGTPKNDVSESRAIARVFDGRTLPVTSTKGSVGHLLGSAGAIEAVATALCLREGRVHPTPGDGELDPETTVHLVREPGGIEGPWRRAVSINLGFGGCNGALALARWDAP